MAITTVPGQRVEDAVETSAVIDTNSSEGMGPATIGSVRTVFITNLGNQDAFIALDKDAIAGTGLVVVKGNDVPVRIESNLTINAITAIASTTLAIQSIEIA